MRRTLSVVLLSSLAWFSGCATYQATREQSFENIQQRRKIWVKQNFDDNKAMALRIAEAFRERGFEVDMGPMTMMSPGFQGVVEYRDAWAWDFREHLVALEIKLLDPKSSALLASAYYSDSVSLFTEPAEVTLKLVDTLYAPKKASKTK